MPLALQVLGLVVLAGALVLLFGCVYAARRKEPDRSASVPRTITGTIDLAGASSHSVEGLEIRYASGGIVRSVRVGAMNQEHKELLLTMDGLVWGTLPNAHKQEVLTAARSTWASKMCPDGPDIAYVVIQTENGRVVGRADPHSVTIV